MEEAGAGAEQIARAFVIAREVFALPDFVTAVEALDNVVPASTQTRLYPSSVACWTGRRAGSSRIVPSASTSPENSIGMPRSSATGVPRLADLLVGSEGSDCVRRPGGYSGTASPESLALATAGLSTRSRARLHGTCAPRPVSRRTRSSCLYFRVSECFGVDALLHRITSLPRGDRWDAFRSGALRDDLYGVLKALTHNAGVDRCGRAASRCGWRPWTETNHENLARARRALAGIERLEKPTIARHVGRLADPPVGRAPADSATGRFRSGGRFRSLRPAIGTGEVWRRGEYEQHAAYGPGSSRGGQPSANNYGRRPRSARRGSSGCTCSPGRLVVADPSFADLVLWCGSSMTGGRLSATCVRQRVRWSSSRTSSRQVCPSATAPCSAPGLPNERRCCGAGTGARPGPVIREEVHSRPRRRGDHRSRHAAA